jgi:hypothetical protein
MTPISRADKVGIDVPFGWPDAFVAAVAEHHDLGSWPPHDALALRIFKTGAVV